MAKEPVISKVKKNRILQLISEGRRIDGRGKLDYRDVRVERGIIGTAEGSAMVCLGQTEVVVGVKVGLNVPYPDTPDEGILTVSAELVPLASPTFEPGPPDERAIELARVVDRGIRSSKAIPLKELCIEPGKRAYILFVDIYILNHDGNLVDASALAALAALMDTKLLGYRLKADGRAVLDSSIWKPLKVQNYPVAVTIANIGGELVVDPCLDEELAMDAKITITVDKDGKVCAIQKSGPGSFTPDQIMEAIDIAGEKAEELRAKLVR
ncbi:MAG TPA: exosome complex protein Rrp42 [Candidatus Bathyarchaeota archaeon]|nr:MAG: RNA-binding protein [Candidatus Bathyarchaeota archaeon]HDJ25848.1 exosome complex protein Rrp42 [Candidatus Bathyarchaeota archaeon]